MVLAVLYQPCLSLSQTTASACTLERRDHYLCDRQAFAARLGRALTVRVETDRMDRFAAEHLRTLAEGLGKQVVAPEAKADLVFELVPIDRSGRIDFGPADVALGTLKVYDPEKGSGMRGLIWAETFDGQGNRPWPSVVIDVIRNFQEHALPQR